MRNFMKAPALLLAACCCAGIVAAQEAPSLLKNGDAETGTLENWHGWDKVVSEGAHGGQHAFLKDGTATVWSVERIPVDPAKTYVLSGWFKSVGAEPSKFYFGFIPCGEDGKPIMVWQVNPVVGSETTLAAPCAKGDMVLKVVNAARWPIVPHLCVAFDIDTTGGYADLPNRKTTHPGVEKIEQKGDAWEIPLKKPCEFDRPAGAPVRAHLSGGSYIYCVAANKEAPKEWTEFRAAIAGIAKAGAPSDKWWPGTKSAQILVIPNYAQPKGFTLLADDITFKEAR